MAPVSRFRVIGRVGVLGSGGIAIRAGLEVGQVFGQEGYEGFWGTKIGWALDHRRSCILYMEEKCKEKCKEKCNQHQWNAVAGVTEPNPKPKPVLSLRNEPENKNES
jgi:hypothetical protein